jgi:hypothetical protein
MSVLAQPGRIGLIAGWGRFPVLVAQALKTAGQEVYCLALRDHADPMLEEICDEFHPANVARLGGHIRYFQRRGITQATLAGKIFKHRLLFRKLGWLSLLPDWRTIRAYFPLFVTRQRNRNDDALLSVVVEEYARSGITLAPATDFAPELLVKPGTLTRRQPTAAEWDDIAFAWRLAKEMGRLDVGQSVVVKGRAVIAVEAVEGTDESIRRAGQLCPQGGFTVVKVAKPQQDMRFDVPTIGRQTIETMVASGGKVLAVEAGKTILLDEADVIRLADAKGISIVAVDAGSIEPGGIPPPKVG